MGPTDVVGHPYRRLLINEVCESTPGGCKAPFFVSFPEPIHQQQPSEEPADVRRIGYASGLLSSQGTQSVAYLEQEP